MNQVKFPFSNGHFNTIYSSLLRGRRSVHFERERLQTADGDFLDIDFKSHVHSKDYVLMVHGLEGSSASGYIRSLTEFLHGRNFSVAVLNLRGCSGVDNNCAISYHSGKTDDLKLAIDHIRKRKVIDRLFLVGFSLGGNIVLKYLGEEGAASNVDAAAAISVPVDLASSAQALSLPGNGVYLNRFLKSLKEKAVRKAQRLDMQQLNIKKVLAARSFRDFDEHYTAPVHGFSGAEEYWRVNSSKALLPAIVTDTLLINAVDDPFLTTECHPVQEARTNSKFRFVLTRYGGHVGFSSDLLLRNGHWYEEQIRAFFEQFRK